ncbi:MAG: TonB-dependent receptor plug domain-containing protein [Muribaculaceae bacterium]|nr:TonB-dependent receptor plug domain-containing protein [Muribaculaceae bacterium]
MKAQLKYIVLTIAGALTTNNSAIVAAGLNTDPTGGDSEYVTERLSYAYRTFRSADTDCCVLRNDSIKSEPTPSQSENEDIKELETLTVTGKSQQQKLRESEFTVNSVNVSAYTNTTATLADLVGRTAGVRIRTEGGLGADFDVSLNGLSGSAVRYFIDGIPMEVRGSEVSLGDLPLNQIARVDIYKGVVPAFLGTDAMGGAINIITKSNRRRYLDASVAAGSYHTYTADVSALATEARTGLIIRPSVSFGYSKNDYMMKDVEVWDKEADKYIVGDRRRFHDAYRSLQAGLDLRIDNRSWADRLMVSGTYSNIDKEIQTGSVQAIVYGQPRRKGHSWSVSGHYLKNNILTDGLTLNADVSYTSDHSQTVDTAYYKYDWNGNRIVSQRNEITGGAKSIRHYVRPLVTGRVNINYTFLNIHTLNLNYSLNLRGNRSYDTLDKDFEPSKDVLSKHIASLSYTQSLIDGRMQNTAFGKLYIEGLEIKQVSDRWNEDTQEKKIKTYPGYGIGSRFNVLEWLQIKASAEHAVRLPLSRELLGNGTTVVANMALRPENSGNFNVGLFGNISLGSAHSLYYEAAGYLRQVRDMIHLITNENTGLSIYNNISKVSVKGIEGEVSYHFDDIFHLMTNWSYSVSRDMNATRSDGKPSVTYRNRIPNRPWLYGNSEATYIHRKLFFPHDRLRVGYSLQYVHWFFLTWEGYGSLSSKSKIPTQVDQNLFLTYSWHKERYNVTLEVKNIFDRTLYDNYKLQKPGRSVMLKLRVFFE